MNKTISSQPNGGWKDNYQLRAKYTTITHGEKQTDLSLKIFTKDGASNIAPQKKKKKKRRTEEKMRSLVLI